MSDSAISLRGLAKKFPGQETNALLPTTTEIPAGKIIGLIGPDGAGKTTLIRLMTGLLTPTEGEAIVLGLNAFSQSHALHEIISYMPQQFGLYEDLTVHQNMELYARLRGLPPEEEKELFSKLLAFSGLSDFQDRLAKNLSGGMKQKLALVTSLLQKPQLMILDEPTVGVDPYARRELWEMMRSLVDQGKSVIWSTSYLDEAEKCDEVLLLNKGELLFQGKPNLLTEKMKERTYLITGLEKSKRAVLNRCLLDPAILDAVIQGMAVRIVLKEGEQLPDLQKITQSSQAKLQQTAPRFEDAFIDLLGGAQKEISPLADRMQSFPDDNKTIINADGLTKRFGNFVATKNVTFSVKRGEIFGLLGPNGAGKSTTFRMLCGLIKPSEGNGEVEGLSLLKAPSEARSKIGYVAQKFSLYSNMTIRQNLEFFAGIYPIKNESRNHAVEDMVSIFSFDSYLNTPSGKLPPGFKQRLALACSLMHRPEVLFLDEPTSGVDPVTRREFWNHINGLVSRGTTVMITTHYMDEAEYCDRIGFLSGGELVAIGSPDELKEKVQTADRPHPTIEDAFVILCKGGE
ncbi:MAG: ABC transporter ATP-binding protein [Chlamydiales bacterium]|nr:ABC transporter ATP-binding protein [Chlamydiia bacterium]MCP5507641.1 ABC transporter ATP-binding protein [Chlamydiales bacterium]